MKNQTAQGINSDYSSDFKLSIVLQLMQTPRRKRKICQENNLDEEVVEKWRQQFLERATGIFSDKGSSPAKAQDPPVVRQESLQSFSEATPSAMPSHDVKFNSSYVRALRKEMQNLLPTWANSYDREQWIKPGVVFWDAPMRKVEHMSAGEASKVLDFLKETEEWRENGFQLKRPVILLRLDERKRGKRKTHEQATYPKPKGQTDFEVVQVRPDVAAELFEVLQSNEIRLREMTVWEEKDRKHRLAQLVEQILSWPMKDDEESTDANRGS